MILRKILCYLTGDGELIETRRQLAEAKQTCIKLADELGKLSRRHMEPRGSLQEGEPGAYHSARPPGPARRRGA